MVAATDNVASYVDLLGYRSLLTRRPELAPPDGWDISEPLGMFNAFHSILDAYALNSLDSHCERLFSWSDCCFIDFGSLTDPENPGHQSGALYRAVLDSERLMYLFIASRVPVRIGIGLGSFETIVVRQQFQEQPKRLIVSSRFLGTAVMSAYMAQQCAPRGLRILLHRDLVASHLDSVPGVVQILPDATSSSCSPGSDGVALQANHEINYLHPKLRESADVTERPVDSNALIEKVSFMLANVSEEHHEHYTNTLDLLRDWSAR